MKSPAFQFYADDFLAGVADMTQGEVGAYILLLCHQWNRGSAPVEPERQQLLAKGSVSAHVLAKFETQPDGTLKNVRLEKEREKQALFRAKQQEKGRLSGQARREPRLNRGLTAAEPSGEPDTQPNTNSPSPSPISYNTPIAPKGALQLRAESIFRNDPSRPLTPKETRAFVRAMPAIQATSEADWQLLEQFYAAPQSETYSRKDLAGLLNNWNGEIDRARTWAGGKAEPSTDIKTRLVAL